VGVEPQSAIAGQAEVKGHENQQYCGNIANAIVVARAEMQQKRLVELEQQLQQRLTEFQSRRSQFQELLDRYDALIKKTDDTLINVYSKMKPESAATQLANLDDESAASLLLQLKPKNSSAILSEMDAFHAALLAKKIVVFSSLKHGPQKP
jgi:flagellar motility protein MotE (MotC chaperone)